MCKFKKRFLSHTFVYDLRTWKILLSDGDFQYDVSEGDDISLHSFPQYPAHLQRYESNTSLNAITRQSKFFTLQFCVSVPTKYTERLNFPLKLNMCSVSY